MRGNFITSKWKLHSLSLTTGCTRVKAHHIRRLHGIHAFTSACFAAWVTTSHIFLSPTLRVPTELIECLKACPFLVALDVARQDGIPCSPTRNSQCLRPALSTSLYTWSTAGDQLLRYLMPAGDIDGIIRQQLCPRLEFLAYHIAGGPMSCTTIEAFILSKCGSGTQGNASLKEFSVNISGGEQDIMRVRHSVEAQLFSGLCLNLTRTAPKLMSTGTYPLTGQRRWWDNE